MGKVKSVVITGHSIGGTTASLSALWLLCHLQQYSLSSAIMPVLCITFGSPLLGNEALHRAILRERWGGNFCHVVSKHDILPRLLFADIGPNYIPKIHALLNFWHFCMASPHLVVTSLSSQLAADVEDLFNCVLRDMELLAQAEESSPSESSFQPFGSYVFCCQEGAICLENAAAVIKMLYLMLATGFPSCSINDHLKYGDYIGKISSQFLLARNLEDLPQYSSFEAGEVEIMAKDCLEKAKTGHNPNLEAAGLAIKLGKAAPYRAEIEWYKALCDEADNQMGYYDSFKLNAGTSVRESRVNMNRHRLAGFWNSVIHMLENNKLPHDFHRRSKWVNASQSYKLLVEPLDIADYYRKGTHRERGHYLQHGRERRYEIFDKWWKDRSVPEKEYKRSKYASLTQDSCFWAKLEEAREWLDNVRTERDVTNRNLLWLKIEEFERYANQMIENKEVSKDVLFKNSSFTRWMGDLKEFKSQVKQFPPLFPGFLDGEVVP
ncbi:Lipase, class 3 [Corchorus olitorius]|uniref:Lipase, class 3 n=1 Tax=Corchorus olitorius TaxID=93759 RepID=A0A1R3K289_9ROSI|nr:Lipase, class 3 [Corchorus olitorius]